MSETDTSTPFGALRQVDTDLERRLAALAAIAVAGL